MTPRTKPPASLLFPALLLGGCAGLLGIDEPMSGPSAPVAEGGDAGAMEPGGAAGSGLAGRSGSGGSQPDAGGRAGAGGTSAGDASSAGAAGESRSAGGAGGDAGTQAAGGAGAGAAGAGEGGGAGVSGPECGSSDFVHHAVVNASCECEGELACQGTLPTKHRLICQGGVWVEDEPCVDLGGEQYCDTRTGVCAPEDWRCDSYTCNGANQAVKCSADRTHIEVVQCVFGCNAGECLRPERDQLVVDGPVPIGVEDDYADWPSWLIPVCFDGSSLPTAEETASVREEASAGWSRYSKIHFSGFDACDDDAPPVARVVVSFKDECDGVLSGIDRYGYPGAANSSNVFFCRKYVDAAGNQQTMNDALRRFVVRHQFGHVLGFPDDLEGFDTRENYGFMTQGVETNRLDELLSSLEYTIDLVEKYGPKRPRSLVTPGGECVRHVGSSFELGDCTGEPEASFRFDELTFGPGNADGQCLTAEPDGSVELATCAEPPGAPEQAFVLRGVEWRALGERCLTLIPALGGSYVLAARPCTGAAIEDWDFDFLANGYVKVRNPSTDYCFGIPADKQHPPPPVQGDSNQYVALCGAANRVTDRFRFRNDGRIEFGEGYCLVPRDPFDNYEIPTTASFYPCSPDPAQVVHVTGRIRSETFGALSLVPAGAKVEFRTALGDAENQIFDLHFGAP